MIKNLRLLFIAILAVLMPYLGLGQFKIVGYQPYWSGSSGIQYSKLTTINYAFALPQSDGHLKALNNPGFLQQIVSNAHAVGAKVFISIGGWSDNGTVLAPTFQSLASSSQGRTNLVNDAMYLVNTYNLDGVDIDWEFPSSGSDANNFAVLMQQLANVLHPQGKQLSAAVQPSAYYGDYILSSTFSYIDYFNIMAYDNTQEANHSSYSFAQSALNYWTGRGLAKSKAILGVPFYARPSWSSYSTLLSQGANPYSDQFGSDYYNGITTIQNKTQLAYNNGGGIMIWELSQDATGQYSLLSAIYSKIQSLGGLGGGNQNPTITLTSPANGSTYNAPASITLSANASDPDGSISRVEFYNGSNLINTDYSSPYSYTWTNVGAGTYTITAKAYDNSTGTATSGVVSITVNNTTTNQPPTVSVTSPSNGATFSAPASITVSANASDADGSVSRVEFYYGSSIIGTDNSTPYSVTWSNVAAGTYSITAKAFDNSGASTTSSAIMVSVNGSTGSCSSPAWSVTAVYTGGALVSYNNHTYKAKWWTQGDQPDLNTGDGKPWQDMGACSGGGGNQNPSVSITSPANGATYTAPASVNITANASDPDGSISKVEFYNGSQLLGSDNSSPYSYSWTNVSAGSYTISVKAYDNSTGTASSSVNITVNAVTTNKAPSVSITSPASGSTYTAPASINISANASDSDGSISKVEFYNGGQLLGSDNSSPYSYSWTNVAVGTYSIIAKAYDNGGASSTSTAVSVSVNTSSGGGCTGVAQYVENGGYTDGSKVQNAGSLYQCRPWPNSGWCNGAAWAYAPGTGAYWQDAWSLVGPCSASAPAAKTAAPTIQGTVSPNPAFDATEVNYNFTSATSGTEMLIVISSSGNIMINEQVNVQAGDNSITIDVHGFNSGIYQIKLGNRSYRFVK